MSFLTKEGVIERMDYGAGWTNYSFQNHSYTINNNRNAIEEWLKDSFRKICVYVNSEEELLEVYNKAKSAGTLAYLIEDNGATEFGGVKTLTCCAIGPHDDEVFFDLTDHLPLL
jgi:PTH2 family peptidyl-tRNA hydrolase